MRQKRNNLVRVRDLSVGDVVKDRGGLFIVMYVGPVKGSVGGLHAMVYSMEGELRVIWAMDNEGYPNERNKYITRFLSVDG